MKKTIDKISNKYPPLYLFLQLFRNSLGAVEGDLQLVHDKFKHSNSENTLAVDLGCGLTPKNLFKADVSIGVDLYENSECNVTKVNLGFEPLPFPNNHFDYITAYDVLEHIPKYADLPNEGNTPFIFLMNEIYRVLKDGGVFLSKTPIYPYVGAFVDPTHNNIMTSDTFQLYFSNEKLKIAEHYGIKSKFKISYQKMLQQSLIAVLKK